MHSLTLHVNYGSIVHRHRLMTCLRYSRTLPPMQTRHTSTVAPPRLSASLILLNSANEILLVQRNPKASSFSGAYVFPGGNYDERQDEKSLALTALRETFEETGILLASKSSPDGGSESGGHPAHWRSTLEEARTAIYSQRTTFSQFLAAHGLVLNTELLKFTTWETPKVVPKRFRTQFFIAFLPPATAKSTVGATIESVLPTPDGAHEVISAKFVHPRKVLDEFAAGRMGIMPPQFYLISTLAGVLDRQDGRDALRHLCSTPFSQMVINPEGEEDERGLTTLRLEGDYTRGGPPGRLHRINARIPRGNRKAPVIPTSMELVRNFDIFTEVQLEAFPLISKL